MDQRFKTSLLISAALLLSACGSTAAPAASTPASAPASGSAAAKPAASASPAAKPAASLTKVNFAYSTISASSYLDWVAEDGGLYRKHGLDIHPQFLSPASTTTATVAGEIDIASSSPGNVAAAVAKGADLVMVAAGHEGPTQSIVARTGINSLQDLKGKKVAATQRGATTDLMMRDLAKELGFGPDDITLVYIPESTAQVAALVSGAADAIVVSDPAMSIAVQQGGHIIYGPGVTQGGSRFVNLSTVAMKRSYLASHRETVKSFLKGDMEAVHLMRTQPDEAIKLVKPYMKLDDDKVLLSSMQNMLNITNNDLSMSMKSLQTVLDSTAISAPEVAKLKPEEMVDMSLIEEIKASGFLKELYGS